jgi:hypothetical protein
MTPVKQLHKDYKRIFGDFVVIPDQVIEMSDVFEREKAREKEEILRAFMIGKLSNQSAEDLSPEKYYHRRFILGTI